MSVEPIMKLWLESFRRFALKYPVKRFNAVVVTTNESPQTESEIGRYADFYDVGAESEYRLSIINAYAVSGTCANLIHLAARDSVDNIWYVHPTIYPVYVRLIAGLEFSIKEGARLVNVSLSPPSELLPMPYRPNEPMNQATKVAADNGALTVFAAGNGGPGEDSLNPWALAPWVMCVGAASTDGTYVAPFSARGRLEDATYRPTIVVPGVDIETPWPFEDAPITARGKGTKNTVSGTSIATAIATGMAANVTEFLYRMRDSVAHRANSKRNYPLTFTWLYDDE